MANLDNQFIKQLVEELGDLIALSSTSQNYMNSIVNPYSDVLFEMKTKEEILEWIPLTFTDRCVELMTTIVMSTNDVSVAKHSVLYIMFMMISRSAQELSDGVITPWNIATVFDTIIRGRKNENILLNKKVAKETTLPIDITNGTNKFTHNLTQDFAFGLLSILSTNKEFNITLNGSEILLNDIQPNYAEDPYDQYEFKATFPQGTVYFDNAEVIQGVITACQWIGIDPHKIIFDLSGVINGERKQLTF